MFTSPAGARRFVLPRAGAAVALYAALPIIAGWWRRRWRRSWPLQRRLVVIGSTASALLIVVGLWFVLRFQVLVCDGLRSQAPAAVAEVRRTDALRLVRLGAAFTNMNVDSLIAEAKASSPGVVSATVARPGRVAHGVIQSIDALLGLFFCWRRRRAGTREASSPLHARGKRRAATSPTPRATILGTARAAQGTSIGIDSPDRETARLRLGAVADCHAHPRRRQRGRVGAGGRRAADPARVRLGARHVQLGKAHPGRDRSRVRSGISRRANLHPMVTLVGVMLGARLGGWSLGGPALAQTGTPLGLFEREYGLCGRPTPKVSQRRSELRARHRVYGDGGAALAEAAARASGLRMSEIRCVRTRPGARAAGNSSICLRLRLPAIDRGASRRTRRLTMAAPRLSSSF